MKNSSLRKAAAAFVLAGTPCSAQTPLVSLDAAGVGATWKNLGSLSGEFSRAGDPRLETIGGIQPVAFVSN